MKTKYKDRETIDKFLIELDNFVDKYPEYARPFILVFKVYSSYQASVFSYKKSLGLKILPKLVNKFTPTGKGIRRTEAYVRRVAYALNYKVVNDFSYEDIFWKMVYQEGLAIPEIVVKEFNKVIPRELIIPEDYYWDNTLYLRKNL